MRMKLLPYVSAVLITSLLLLNQTYGQLTVAGGQTPAQLVQNVLLGSGVTVSNITYTGANNAIGTFNGTNSNIGLNSGIIITTGARTIAPGPNNTGNAGADNSMPGDPDLNPISNAGTEDAAVLEFDFVPTSDTVSFRYVFASEEYPEFVGLGYNDVFAFFISGPGIVGQKNMALLPGTTTPVTIDNVNSTTNPAFYVNNGTGTTPALNPTVQYDGFTKVLTATSPVQCGATYHLKIAIADAGDAFYDSGVFLEAGSLNALGGIDIQSEVDFGGNDTVLYEGCGTAKVTVSRFGPTNQPFSVNYTIGGTATMGTDYNNLSGVVNFPPGNGVQVITIQAPDDGIFDPNETIILTFTYTICNQTTTKVVSFLIAEPTPITVDLGPDKQFTCQDAGNDVVLTPVIAGGVSPYSYTWSTGATSPSITVPAGGNVAFHVTVTDVCNSSVASDTIKFEVIDAQPILLTVSNDTIVCPGSTVTLVAEATGGNGGMQYLWNTGATSPSITVTPSNQSVFYVTVSDNCGIEVTDTVMVRLFVADANFYFVQTDSLEGTIQFTDTSTGNIDTWLWSFGDGLQSSDQHPEHDYEQPGYYEVTLVVTTVEGCTDSITKTIPVYTATYIYIPNSFTPNQNGLNEYWSMGGTGYANFELLVFDRWGQRVYESNSNKPGWPGTNQDGNVKLPLGVYVYRIDLLDGKLMPRTYRGHINLIR